MESVSSRISSRICTGQQRERERERRMRMERGARRSVGERENGRKRLEHTFSSTSDSLIPYLHY